MINFKPISFDRWLKLNFSGIIDLEEFEVEHDCERCGGVGTMVFRNIKCFTCEGTGNILKKEYEDRIKSDRKLWNKYQK